MSSASLPPCWPPGEVRVDQKEKMVDCKVHVEKVLQQCLSCFGPLLSNAEVVLFACEFYVRLSQPKVSFGAFYAFTQITFQRVSGKPE